MFFNKIFHFVKGYVIIKVSGSGIERFLYICAKRKISLFGMGEPIDGGITLCISISDFRNLRPAAKKTGVNVRILKKCGLPFCISSLKRRYVLIVGFVLLFGLMLVSTLFIWTVEIQATEGGIPDSLPPAIEKAGIHIGAFKPTLRKGDDIKNIILDNTDNIIWAWAYIKGTKAVIEYRSGIPAPKPVDMAIPCDIAARRDGLIVSVTEKNGKAAVKKGDTVLKGDVLISGISDSDTDKGMPVHAIGDIKAYTWHERVRDYSLTRKIPRPTGRTKCFYTLKLFSKCINLYKTEETGFDNYTITESTYELSVGKGNYLGVGIYKKEYAEAYEEEVPCDYDETVRNAVYELEEEIAKELLCGSVLADKKITHEKTDENTLRVSVTMEFIENIGEEIIH